MTPVYVKSIMEDSGMCFYFEVPQESPTVRGFASIMAQGVNGSTPQEVLAIPNDFFLDMGLESILTMQRLNGFAAILAHMKRLAARHLEE
jgi:cysteine desulfuration protein SufE